MPCGCGFGFLGGDVLTMTGHFWRRSTFGTNVVCDRCGLLPLDSDDWDSDCAADAAVTA